MAPRDPRRPRDGGKGGVPADAADGSPAQGPSSQRHSPQRPVSQRPSEETRTRLCLAAVTGAYGIKGEIKLKPFTADPLDVAAYGPLTADGGRTLTLTAVKPVKGILVARAAEIGDRTAAEALKGQRLYVDRSALPALDTGDEDGDRGVADGGANEGVTDEDDEYYHADLIGLGVDLPDGARLGTVTALYDFGAGDLLEVALEPAFGGRRVLLPFTKAAVPEVDIAGGRLVADPPAGLLDEPAAEKAPGDERE